MDRVYIDGVGHTNFGYDDRELEVIMADAGRQALATSKIKKPDVVIIGNYGSMVYGGMGSLDALVGAALDLDTRTPIFRVERGSASGAVAVEAAFRLVQGGYHVLVIGGEKMKSASFDPVAVRKGISKVIDIREREFLNMSTIAGLATKEYMKRYGFSEEGIREVFFQRLKRNRHNGAKNPYAHFGELTREEYFNSEANPRIVGPLHKYDCAGIYNGAAAVFLVPEETDLELAGINSAFAPVKISDRVTLVSLDSNVDAIRALLLDTRVNACDIDLFELHDAFASVPIIFIEDLNLFKRGEGCELFKGQYGEEVKNKLGKRIFYNLSGGFLSKTHPLGASGTAQLVELSLQIRCLEQYSDILGDKDINYGLWFSMDGFGIYNVVGLVKKTGYTNRNTFNSEALPSRYTPGGSPETLVGMAATPRGSHPGVGVVLTETGELQLGHVEDVEQALGKRVNVVNGTDGPYFVPISPPTVEFLRDHLRWLPRKPRLITVSR